MSRHSIGSPGLNGTIDATGLAGFPGATGDVGHSVSIDPLIPLQTVTDGVPDMLQMVHREPLEPHNL